MATLISLILLTMNLATFNGLRTNPLALCCTLLKGVFFRLKEMCGDKGLVLQWCDQLRVLQHHAIGG